MTDGLPRWAVALAAALESVSPGRAWPDLAPAAALDGEPSIVWTVDDEGETAGGFDGGMPGPVAVEISCAAARRMAADGLRRRMVAELKARGLVDSVGPASADYDPATKLRRSVVSIDLHPYP